MALKSTIYKADLQLVDLDRHVYGDHALTLARHPSETVERMMVRVLAYALHAQDGIAFTRGLSEVDEPDVWTKNLAGETTLWIDIGQPDEARIRRACSRADQVVVLCYAASSDIWWQAIAGKLTRFANLTVLQLPAATAQSLGALAERGMRLQCLVQDGEIWINTPIESVVVKLARLQSPA
ncbi:MAG: YaeQ family protein [Thiobacillus sp.]